MLVATAPTVYGIETIYAPDARVCDTHFIVATAPTVYGIETHYLKNL